MLRKFVLSVGVATCIIAGTFAINANNSVAYAAADCLAGPNRPSGPGTHWHYRINHTTHQRCWYLKRVGGRSHPRPSGEAHTRRSHEARATPSRAVSQSSEARARPTEVATAAPVESESSIKAWFTATFSALSGAATSGTKIVTPEPVTSEPALHKRRSNDAERSERTKSERSEKTKTARMQQRPAPAQAAGDKAAEAAGDKDVTLPPSSGSDEPEWQKQLYQEFLQWRVKQLLFE